MRAGVAIALGAALGHIGAGAAGAASALASAAPGARPAAAQLPADAADAELRVLLSSIDMTVSLIDAYGQCREREGSHERCMALIRETLDHARSMIGR